LGVVAFQVEDGSGSDHFVLDRLVVGNGQGHREQRGNDLLMVRALLLISLGAGLVGVADALWGGVWKTEGWIVVCLGALVAAQVVERMRA
jgi:hypothetical protein